jgi:hypothetical protein
MCSSLSGKHPSSSPSATPLGQALHLCRLPAEARKQLEEPEASSAKGHSPAVQGDAVVIVVLSVGGDTWPPLPNSWSIQRDFTIVAMVWSHALSMAGNPCGVGVGSTER